MPTMLLINSPDMPTKDLSKGKKLRVCKQCGHPWIKRPKKNPKAEDRCPNCGTRAVDREKITETGRPKGSKTSKPSRNAKRRR